MKQTIVFTILSLFLINCSSVKVKPKDPSFIDKAKSALNEYQETCTKENSSTWGKSLCVPMVIVERETLTTVASKLDPKGQFKKNQSTYLGKYYGPKVYANTSIKWEDQTWSMVLWPLPDNKEDRVELLMHEAWHSIQNDLGLPMHSLFLDHLDQYDGRLLVRLEWNALHKALVETPGKKKEYIQKALLFRALRYKKFPQAQDKEKVLDFNEGLAAYTGTKLRTDRFSEISNYLRNKLDKVPKVSSLARSASYYTGPLYGLLLDQSKSDWKTQLNKTAGLGELLRSSYNLKRVKNPKLPPKKYLDKFGYTSINSFELKRKKEQKAKIASYLNNIGTKDSVRIVPSPGAPGMFDPRGILVVGTDDYIYTYYETTDKWGTLKVSDGVRIKNIKGKKTLFLGKPGEQKSSSIKGNGWNLQLNKGWALKKN